MVIEYIFYYYYLPFGFLIVHDPLSRRFLMYLMKTGLYELVSIFCSTSLTVGNFGIDQTVKATGKLRRRYRTHQLAQKIEEEDWIVIG